MRILVPLTLALASCSSSPKNSFGFDSLDLDRDTLPTRIAFGSCADQNRPQPILHKVIERDPDLFVYLGDNIYGDTEQMPVLHAKYGVLAAREEFRALRAHCPTLAVWDDHDFGANDSGRHYPKKRESREIFLDFWQEPADSSRRSHDGIYHAERFEKDGRALQIILLDTRTFRDDLIRNGANSTGPWKHDYRPNDDPSATILGDQQWAWLGERLSEPADLRIIATSIQFGHSYNGWESWTNVPHERDRMIDLIRETNANGVVFVSGDVHWGEINRQDVEGGYPLYDVTASGLNNDWDVIEPSTRRVGPAIAEYNFGLIEIDWQESDPTVQLIAVDAAGNERNRVELRLSDLRVRRSG